MLRRASVADAVAPPAAPQAGRGETEQAYWRSLRFFALSRVVVAALLVAYVPVLGGAGLGGRFDLSLFAATALVYLIFAVGLVVVSRPGRLDLRPMALVQVGVDLVMLMLLAFAAPGQGLEVLLLLPVAGAAILVGVRLALFAAALATLVLVADGAAQWLRGGATDLMLMQAGLTGAGMMATALLVGGLAARLASQEQLAWQRGQDLLNQLAVTQAVIGELPDGVLVLGRGGELRAFNRSAREMLGVEQGGAPSPGLLPLRAALGLRAGHDDEGLTTETDVAEFVVPAEGGAAERRLRARRIETASGGADAVIVLEDLGRVEARAQQLKLASMGRLSASIAHEIRNPLSAIQHANSLLAEKLDDARLNRLAAIIEDNSRRIDRVIEDVLAIARRGAATPETLPAGEFLARAVSEHLSRSGADPARVACIVSGELPIRFDADHLRQVLDNLLANALRHATAAAGAVTVEWRVDAAGRATLGVLDDGPGVPPAVRPHLFEPFFTTEARGTGLGLYLARELCTANGATIRYRPPGDNPPLRGGFVLEPAALPSR